MGSFQTFIHETPHCVNIPGILIISLNFGKSNLEEHHGFTNRKLHVSLELHSCLNNNLNAPPPPQQLTCCQQAKWIRSHMTSPSQLKVSPSQSRHPLLSPGIPLPQCFYQDIPVPSQTSPSHDNFQLRQGYPKSEGDTRGYLYMC